MESKFTGGLLGSIGIGIASFFLTVFTLGFGAPWAICMRHRWLSKHTIIDGRQLKFVGTGGELFVKYIIWMLLSAITLGIYSFWFGIKLQQWKTKNTHFAS